MPLFAPKIRGDLTYQPDPLEEGRYYVKDPVRGDFFQFNEIQVAMMRALDGKRTLPQVQRVLVESLDVEVPLPALERFVHRLEISLLLDVTSYKVNDDKTRRSILAFLRKRKLAFRVSVRNETSPEAQLFSAATRQLHDGDPCLAASYFEAVLEINPENERARQVLQCIHEAFFRTKIVSPSWLVMWKLWNPDRFLTALDRYVGRFVFSELGVAIFALIIVSSVWPAIDVLTNPGTFDDIGLHTVPVAVLILMVQMLVHELSHGLACKHYGGHVEDLGVLLIYGVSPGAYCDVSESYLFPQTRHKIVVQVAGTFGHMVLQALCWHLLSITDPSLPLWSPLLVVNLMGLYANLTNMIPLSKFDAYYALAEYLRLPNLRDRSFGYLRQWLAMTVLGVKSSAPAPTRRERRIFLVYGILASCFTVFLIYYLFISVLLPRLMSILGTLGLVLAVLYFARLILFDVLRNVLRFLRFVFHQRGTIFTWRRSAAFAVAAGGVVVVASLPWPLRVEGDALIEPQLRAIVRAQEAGFLEDVSVREGQSVEPGQVLARLRSDELLRDRVMRQQDLDVARAELEMLRRGAKHEELEVARAHNVLAATRYRVASARLLEATRYRRQNVASDEAVVAAAATASQAGGRARISGHDEAIIRAGAREEELEVQHAKVRRAESMLRALDVRIANLEVRSPIAGLVITKRPADAHGLWAKPGDELFEVHDVSRWQVRITPDFGEPLDTLAIGQWIEVRTRGDSKSIISAQLEVILPPDETSGLVVLASSDTHAGWRSGMTGRARIYVPARSIAYRVVALPIRRLVEFDLWRMR
jgi:multidrug efflux pump subunit AcrA (membrane-fusion protein)